MKKNITLLLLACFTLVSCNGDASINRNSISKNYNTSMQSIDLSDMNLTRIPDFSSYSTGEVFFDAVSIDMSDNNIDGFTTQDFENFTNLRELNLKGNKIKIINNFKTDMDILDVSENQIEIIDFASGSLLRDLYLSGNVISFGADMNLPTNIINLNLANNKLQNIDGISQLKRMRFLDVSGNQLGDQDLVEVKGMNQIRYLAIDGNTEMSAERIASFEKFNQKYIDAANQKITTPETMSGSVTQ